MRLFEFEGKELWQSVGIEVPGSVMVSSGEDLKVLGFGPSTKVGRGTRLRFPVMVKAQVLSGRRGKRGLVEQVEDRRLLGELVDRLIGREVDGEKVEKVLVEEVVKIEREMYLAITYSTKTRGPVLLFSDKGGVEVEEMGGVKELGLDFNSDGISNDQVSICDQSSMVSDQLKGVVEKLWGLFEGRDLFLAEINPLVLTDRGELMALDAKVVTDDAAGFRQKWDLPERNMLGRGKSWAEVEAEKIDATDHRGVVGRVYLDLSGDIGMIAAGGGASLVAMDALVSYGMRPANYTEFSGNPPAEKVKRLTEIVLSKEGLKGAMLVGGKANFTDQFETLSGFVEGLKKVKPRYPIVVRRDGPRMKEAKRMLEEAKGKFGFELYVYDSKVSIMEAVDKLRGLVNSKL